jgi:hypothetical protein
LLACGKLADPRPIRRFFAQSISHGIRLAAFTARPLRVRILPAVRMLDPMRSVKESLLWMLASKSGTLIDVHS